MQDAAVQYVSFKEMELRKGVICLCRCLGIWQEVGELFQEILMRPEQHCNLQ